MATHCIVGEMDAWYKRRLAIRPSEHLTRFHLSRKKRGDVSHRACESKCADTYGLCIWLAEALFRHRRSEKEVAKMAEAGRNLMDMVDILNAHGCSHPQAAVADAFRHYQRFLALTVGHAGAPKRHLMLHCLRNIPEIGSPRLYSIWLDETLARKLKRACRTISQQTFDASVVLHMHTLLCQERKRGIKRCR